MSKVYCNRCGFGYEGGCPKHHPQIPDTIVVEQKEETKPGLFKQIINKLKNLM